MKNTKVIYHRADFDGIFCREIARKFLGDTAEYVGWDYGDPLPHLPPHDDNDKPAVQLYMLDISVEGLMDYPGLIWIDHHKSAMEKFPPQIVGYRIDGVAACRLAWQWFTNMESRRGSGNELPYKEEYVNRTVVEPFAVQLAGEYDIWDKRDPRAELFQHGLRSRELTQEIWDAILGNVTDHSITVDALLEGGRMLQYAKTAENESIIQASGFTFKWEGLTFLACNHARYNSHLFTAGLTPEHDGCFGFCWRDGKWTVSLYHAPGKEYHDLSKIAVKYGGGGHKGACGFRTDKLPFLP